MYTFVSHKSFGQLDISPKNFIFLKTFDSELCYFDYVKQSAADALKTVSKKAIQKKSEATGDLNGNKIPDKITGVSKTSPKNNSEANEEKMVREKYISPELRPKIMMI